MYVAMWICDIITLMNYAQYIVTGGSWASVASAIFGSQA